MEIDNTIQPISGKEKSEPAVKDKGTPPMMIYSYKASHASIIALLVRKTRTLTEMVRWNTNSDTFIRGQWLGGGKLIDYKRAAICGKGVYFGYTYFTYLAKDNHREKGYCIRSKIPNFTAVEFSTGHDHWSTGEFDDTYTGVQTEPFQDNRGRTIHTEAGKVFVNRILVYDKSDHEFEAKNPLVTKNDSSTHRRGYKIPRKPNL